MKAMSNENQDSTATGIQPETYELPMCPFCRAPVNFQIDGVVVWAAFCTNEDCGRFRLVFDEEYLGID